MRKARLAAYVATPLMALGVLGGIVQASPAGAATGGFNVTSTVTNRPDSGSQGNDWALDNFSATLHLSTSGIVANSNCPGITIGACRAFTGTITDKGTFTTQIGQVVPGTGSLNGNPAPTMGAAVTGNMTGTLPYHFYANVLLSQFKASNAPSLTVDGASPGTGQWPEQFAPAGTQFWDTSGNTGGPEYLGTSTFNFTYTAALGSDHLCPNVSGRWVDSSAATSNSGSAPGAGNILAPDADHC
jgi:hypothetical protein